MGAARKQRLIASTSLSQWPLNALVCLAAWCSGTAAHADSLLPMREVSVKDRPRPEYEAAGIRMGLLRISPSLSVGESYDDNVFAEDSPRLNDTLTTLRSAVALSAQTRMPWSLVGTVTRQDYADFSSEDHTDWSAGGSLTQPIGQRTRATLSALAAQTHGSRDDASFPAEAAEPPSLLTRNAKLDFLHPFASGQLSLSASFETNDYDDAKLVGGGRFDQDFRDRDVWKIDARTDFAVGSTTALFVRLTHIEQRYRNDDIASALDRDATSDAIYGGTAFLISNLMRADLGVGALRVDNKDPSQKDRTSLAFSGNLEFYVSQLITATLELQRTSGAADIAGSSSFIVTTGTFGLDYELRRNLILSLQASRSQREYSGLGKKDETEYYAFTARWLINRHAQLSLEVGREDQDWAASSADKKFTQNVYSATFDFML